MGRSSSVCEENSEVDCPTSCEFKVDTPRCEHSLDCSCNFSEISSYSEPSSSDEPLHLLWPVARSTKLGAKQHDEVLNSEIELIKERFSKLLLGEDMSGSGRGVCTAVAISNAITNLYATIFGQFWRLEPLSAEKKSMWRREMDCLLSVCDYIVEFYPSLITLPDGRTVEVMESRPRSDIYINRPALEKLDAMLIEILDSFEKTEFWYVDDEQSSLGSVTSSMSRSFRRASHRKEEKWWLPVPCVPDYGLHNTSRAELKRKSELVGQIHKAAMAINSSILADMLVPDSYLATLPKSGRKSLRHPIYRDMSTSNKFSPDYLLDCLDITSEHKALQLADSVEAAMYVWRRKATKGHPKFSWNKVKGIMIHENKNTTLANRAESLLLCLKQRYPGLSQTMFDTCKIEFNRDVGQAVLEGYSRVLEGLAFNIVAWINDVLYMDGSVRK